MIKQHETYSHCLKQNLRKCLYLPLIQSIGCLKRMCIMSERHPLDESLIHSWERDYFQIIVTKGFTLFRNLKALGCSEGCVD